jgi:hypothetical protein
MGNNRQNKTQFGLLSYGWSLNIGDEIQSLAAAQFLPRVDRLVERDRLHWPMDCARLFVILNGWFTHQRVWPPPLKIQPLFVSFYAHRPIELIKPEFREYFKTYEPIGCRSPATANALRSLGVEAYFSGCLTLTLRRPECERTDIIYAVDVEEDLFHALVPQQLRQRSVQLTHDFPDRSLGTIRKSMWQGHDLAFRVFNKLDHNRAVMPFLRYKLDVKRHNLRMSLAEEMLRRYKTAAFVITSRLHVALPCLALGTPVVLLKRGIRTDVRFEGVRDFVNHLDEHSSKSDYDWNRPPQNPDRHVVFAEALRERCQRAVEAAVCADN